MWQADQREEERRRLFMSQNAGSATRPIADVQLQWDQAWSPRTGAACISVRGGLLSPMALKQPRAAPLLRHPYRRADVRLGLAVGHAGVVHHPVGLPGVAAVLGERLLPARCPRRHARPDEPHQDRPTLEDVLGFEDAAVTVERADHG